MTIMPWYDCPQIKELFKSITDANIDKVQIDLIIRTIAQKVRDPYLVESLNELIYDWRNLQGATIQ